MIAPDMMPHAPPDIDDISGAAKAAHAPITPPQTAERHALMLISRRLLPLPAFRQLPIFSPADSRHATPLRCLISPPPPKYGRRLSAAIDRQDAADYCQPYCAGLRRRVTPDIASPLPLLANAEPFARRRHYAFRHCRAIRLAILRQHCGRHISFSRRRLRFRRLADEGRLSIMLSAIFTPCDDFSKATAED